MCFYCVPFHAKDMCLILSSVSSVFETKKLYFACACFPRKKEIWPLGGGGGGCFCCPAHGFMSIS